MKQFIKKFIPKKLLLFYHKVLAISAAFFYSHPSEKMIVIGVTGTSGKSTVVFLVTRILEAAGFKVGSTSTVNIMIAGQEFPNDSKMTMFGRFRLQKTLRQMVRAGCQYACIEVSSEGIAQSRHLGINFDIGIFTNLSPEHIESHGSYENYKRAKLKLFESISQSKNKTIDGKKIEKTCVVNLDDREARNFCQYDIQNNFGFTVHDTSPVTAGQKTIKAENIKVASSGSQFEVDGADFKIKLLGEFNLANAMAALAVAKSQGIELLKCQKALAEFSGVPGRMEIVAERPFAVIIDFAFLPQAFEKIYQTIEKLPHRKIIHVFGGTGGGRDKARRPLLGKFAAEHADYVIVTNEDPYDEDPMRIIEDVTKGVYQSHKKTEGRDFWKILDRREAIKKALALAKEKDIVLVTGKGSESVMAVKGGKKIPWEDRKVIKEEIHRLNLS